MLGAVVDLALDELDRLHEPVSYRFARAEPHARARRYVAGLELKNGWTLAEQAEEVSLDGMRRLPRSANVTAELVQTGHKTRRSRPLCGTLAMATAEGGPGNCQVFGFSRTQEPSDQGLAFQPTYSMA